MRSTWWFLCYYVLPCISSPLICSFPICAPETYSYLSFTICKSCATDLSFDTIQLCASWICPGNSELSWVLMWSNYGAGWFQLLPTRRYSYCQDFLESSMLVCLQIYLDLCHNFYEYVLGCLSCSSVISLFLHWMRQSLFFTTVAFLKSLVFGVFFIS